MNEVTNVKMDSEKGDAIVSYDASGVSGYTIKVHGTGIYDSVDVLTGGTLTDSEQAYVMQRLIQIACDQARKLAAITVALSS